MKATIITLQFIAALVAAILGAVTIFSDTDLHTGTVLALALYFLLECCNQFLNYRKEKQL
ncbi:hypothetical protein JTE88_08255 [Arcanobacterium phocisimile]|uniref:TMhelix containing protein n=1 Tax=Arcanobacterium phocisimile TaxID=1302235 RepID=A0ABX7IFY4_9ACTO|nr:hypothetical protein [Arcanobacterium phocisimile]QRV02051.1 hypothetical protein JTE88_08255 [Arcanobacterium phocisimile]